MQRLAIVAGLALLALAIFVGVASRGKDPDFGESDEPQRGGNHSAASQSGGTTAAERSGKSSRSRNDRKAVAPIYSGPNALAGWVQDYARQEDAEAPWQFVDGKLVSSRRGGIARGIAAPPRSKLSFKLEWNSSLRFRILWGSDDGETTQPDNCYDLVIQRRFVYLRKRWAQKDSGGSRIVGQANVATLAEGEEAFFEFYLDRESGLITLYVNGERAHVFIDADPAVAVFGDWLHFISEDFYPLEISELKVESWNGYLPDGTRGQDLIEDQKARRDRAEALKPRASWPPRIEYRDASRRAQFLRDRATSSDNPDDLAAAAEATLAAAEAKKRYDQTLKDLPVAEHDPKRPGHVINPYTGQSLDRRGVPGGTRIRDPNDPERERTFRIP